MISKSLAIIAVVLGSLLVTPVPHASAVAAYGPGNCSAPALVCGLLQVAGIGGIPSGSIIDLIRGVLGNVLTYVILVGVVGIIVAGLYLIFSQGDETQKEKAKKSIIYIIVGVGIIILARTIVLFVNNLFLS